MEILRSQNKNNDFSMNFAWLNLVSVNDFYNEYVVNIIGGGAL